MVMDETLYQVQAKVQNFAVIYLGEFEVCLRVKGLCDGVAGMVDVYGCEVASDMRGWADRWMLDILKRTVTDELSTVDITKVPDFNKVSLLPSISFCACIANPEIGNGRCTNCTIHVPSCSFTGKSLLLPFSVLFCWRDG
jgi:hypothetical protein